MTHRLPGPCPGPVAQEAVSHPPGFSWGRGQGFDVPHCPWWWWEDRLPEQGAPAAARSFRGAGLL